jgi:hypothetical protein
LPVVVKKSSLKKCVRATGWMLIKASSSKTSGWTWLVFVEGGTLQWGYRDDVMYDWIHLRSNTFSLLYGWNLRLLTLCTWSIWIGWKMYSHPLMIIIDIFMKVSPDTLVWK